jgi:predicted metalloprotease with PDZ domain
MKWQVWLFSTSLAALLAQPLAAQTLLERLEQRLNQAPAPTPAERPAPEPAPATPAPPAQPGYLGLVADAQDNAVIVHTIRVGGPADLAGVRRGDRLISAGEVLLTNLDDLARVLHQLPAGAKVDFIIERAGENRKVVVTLGQRDPQAADGPMEDLPAPRNQDGLLTEPLEPEMAGRAVLGVRAATVTADLQRRYGLTVRQGAVIEGVQDGSPAARYGLPLGAAIVAVDGARVDTSDDLAALVAGHAPGDVIELSYYVRDQAYRKQVRLVPAAVDAPLPNDRVPADRPLLRTLERALDNVAPPPVRGDGEVQALRAQMAAMQERLDQLEARVRELESQPVSPPLP